VLISHYHLSLLLPSSALPVNVLREPNEKKELRLRCMLVLLALISPLHPDGITIIKERRMRLMMMIMK
jgi:hypothetical protein